MPRIRKKTSNRASTNHRARIKHKVAESRKKSKKAAKKNPQWKSKHKKDPGIPSNFPYKDQILAEVAEERRQTAEAKQRRKDEKKAAKGIAVEEVQESENERSDGGGSETVFDGISGVQGRAKFKAKIAKTKEIEEEEDVPILINRSLSSLRSVLDQADVILYILDARDPLSHRSSHLEELISAESGTNALFILNKIDTCPRESVTSWLSHLRNNRPTLLFRSASAFLPAPAESVVKEKGKAKARADDGEGVQPVLACLHKLAEERGGDVPLAVAVVGLTNSGKSSFINTLLSKPTLATYKLTSSPQGPTTTLLPQEVTLTLASGKHIRLIDTPGLSWVSTDDSDQSPEIVGAGRARDILLRNKGRIDRLKDPSHAVEQIVARANTEDLMLQYNVPAFTKGDREAFLSGVVRTTGLIKKRGILDLTAASRIVLRDWNRGKFPWYTTAPPSPSAASGSLDSKFADIYDKDEAILSTLRTRKEMRKDGGAVKFLPGSIDDRKVAADAPWAAIGNDDDISAGSEEDSGDDEDSACDEEEDSEEDDAEEEPVPTLLVANQKRKRRKEAVLPPNKKVAFAPDPKSSKQSRLGGSRKTAPIPPKPKSTKISQALIPKPKKVANIVTKSSKGTSTAESGEEAYDFGKYF